MSAAIEQTHDVVIVGYGPVGALAALLLEDAGLRIAVLERSSEPVVLPRAVGLDGESLRAFQRIGFGAAVAAILQPPREVDRVCFTNSKREPLFGIDLPKYGANGWRDTSFFDQPELEALLRKRVATRERIDVFLGHEVTGLEPSRDGVVVRCANEPRLPRVWLAQYSELVELERQAVVEIVVGRRPLPVVARHGLAEEESGHRGMSTEHVSDSAARQYPADAFL